MLTANYQFVVDSSALQNSAPGGTVFVYATGRAGTSGKYVCQSAKASLWVQTISSAVSQSIPVSNSWGNIVTPGASTSTVVVTFAGGAGGPGGNGAGIGGSGANGGFGQEIQATFAIPQTANIGTLVGRQGARGGSGGTGYGQGGAGGNDSGSGGGGTALCAYTGATSPCTSSTPVRSAAITTAMLPCVFAVAGGGGGGGEGVCAGSSAGTGGNGGNSAGAFSTLERRRGHHVHVADADLGGYGRQRRRRVTPGPWAWTPARPAVASGPRPTQPPVVAPARAITSSPTGSIRPPTATRGHQVRLSI